MGRFRTEDMETIERPTFEGTADKQIYEYVERRGITHRDELLEAVSLPTEEFHTQLDHLKSEGYLEEEDGSLRVSIDIGAVDEYETDEFTYTVRQGLQSDFEGLVDTIRDVTSEETYVVAEGIAEQLLYEDTVTRHNTVESRVFFVATVDGAVVGWTHLDLPQLPQLRETAQQTVGVRSEYRGYGVGGTLLQRGLDWAEANGYRKVYNSLPTTNERAIEFLDAHGWDTEAIRRDHYTIGDETVDEVMMAYTF